MHRHRFCRESGRKQVKVFAGEFQDDTAQALDQCLVAEADHGGVCQLEHELAVAYLGGDGEVRQAVVKLETDGAGVGVVGDVGDCECPGECPSLTFHLVIDDVVECLWGDGEGGMGAAEMQVGGVGVVNILGVELYYGAYAQVGGGQGSYAHVDLWEGLGGESEEDGGGAEGGADGDAYGGAALFVAGVVRAVFVDFGGDRVRNLVADAVACVEFDAQADQQDGEEENDDEGDGGPSAAG